MPAPDDRNFTGDCMHIVEVSAMFSVEGLLQSLRNLKYLNTVIAKPDDYEFSPFVMPLYSPEIAFIHLAVSTF